MNFMVKKAVSLCDLCGKPAVSQLSTFNFQLSIFNFQFSIVRLRRFFDLHFLAEADALELGDAVQNIAPFRA